MKVITEALGTKSPSCSLQEPSLPDGFLHSSPKIWPLLWHCCHLKAVLWRFLKFRRGWDTPTDLGRFRFNSRAAALGSCQPTCWLQGWEVTGSHGQGRAPKSTDEHPEISQGRQQVPPVSVQMTPNTWEECGQELRKSLPQTAKEAKNHPDPSTVRFRLIPSVRLRTHHEVMDKPLPSCKEFQTAILE